MNLCLMNEKTSSTITVQTYIQMFLSLRCILASLLADDLFVSQRRCKDDRAEGVNMSTFDDFETAGPISIKFGM